MNIAVKGYRRTLSAEELADKTVMITREALRFFPKPFKKFSLLIGEKSHELAIESKECTCRGPANPHEHYWIPMKDCLEGLRWERGARVTVKKEKDLTYRLTME